MLVLAAALALSDALSSLARRRGGMDGMSTAEASSGGGGAEGSTEAIGALSRAATRLLMLHFVAEGVRNMWMAVEGEAGFQLDDAAVIITNDTPVVSPTPAWRGRGFANPNTTLTPTPTPNPNPNQVSPTPPGGDEVGALSLAYATALVLLAQALGNEPRWLRGALGLLQCAAAAHVLAGRPLSRRRGAATLGAAAALCGFAAAAAAHVLLSLLYVQLLGGGLHSNVKVPPPWQQRASSAPAPPQGSPGGSEQPNTPVQRRDHWAPRHRPARSG